MMSVVINPINSINPIVKIVEPGLLFIKANQIVLIHSFSLNY